MLISLVTSRFAVAKVIQAYSVLLAKFESNTREINHYVAKMFHRVGYDIKMYGLMFQASIFRVFQKVQTRVVYSAVHLTGGS